jgi:hypothetical protein
MTPVTTHGNLTGIWKIMAAPNYFSSLTKPMRKSQYAANSAQPAMMILLDVPQGS